MPSPDLDEALAQAKFKLGLKQSHADHEEYAQALAGWIGAVSLIVDALSPVTCEEPKCSCWDHRARQALAAFVAAFPEGAKDG